MPPSRQTRLVSYLEKQPRWRLLVVGFVLIGLLGVEDYFTGNELAFGVFYLLPVTLVAYFTSLPAGLLASVTSAGVWLGVELAVSPTRAQALSSIWELGTRFGFFLVVTLLLASLRRAYHDQSRLAHTDPLTGVDNVRSFQEVTNLELRRARRHPRPTSVVHLDVDNFKALNDQLGHNEGDVVLREVAATLRHAVRVTDTVARLGGDEFAVLLPETDPEGARAVAGKLQRRLTELMQARGRAVSFSIGVLTCLDPPGSAEELLRLVDRLTYAAKSAGKNTIHSDTVVARLVSADQVSPVPSAR